MYTRETSSFLYREESLEERDGRFKLRLDEDGGTEGRALTNLEIFKKIPIERPMKSFVETRHLREMSPDCNVYKFSIIGISERYQTLEFIGTLSLIIADIENVER